MFTTTLTDCGSLRSGNLNFSIGFSGATDLRRSRSKTLEVTLPLLFGCLLIIINSNARHICILFLSFYWRVLQNNNTLQDFLKSHIITGKTAYPNKN